LNVPPNPPTGLSLSFTCDDAVIFYLNGSPLGRYAKGPIGTFSSIADTYYLLAPNAHDLGEETEPRTVVFPAAQLRPGPNTLAVSLHNSFPTSSDLGFQLLRVDSGTLAKPTYVTVAINDANQPPVLVSDTYSVSGSNLSVSSYLIGGSAYKNDGLISEKGIAYDPILEAEISTSSTGPVSFDKDTGHFSLPLPRKFFGMTRFTYRVRDKDGWSNSAIVSINVLPSSAWDVWRSKNIGGDWAFPAASADFDLDNDGIPNALEYLMDQDPGKIDFTTPLKLKWNRDTWEMTFDLNQDKLGEFFVDLETSQNPSLPKWQKLARLSGQVWQFNRFQLGATLNVEPIGRLMRHTVSWQGDGNAPAFFRLKAERVPNVLDP